MKTRNLKKVHAELERAWGSGESVALARTGLRSFVVGQEPVKPGEFTFGKGFNSETEPHQVSDKKTTFNGRLSSVERPWKLAFVLTVVLMAAALIYKVYPVAKLIVASGMVTVGPSGLNIFDKQTMESASAASSTAAKSDSGAIDDASWLALCTPKVRPSAPLKSGDKIGTTTVTVLHDMTVGGTRSQSLTGICSGRETAYSVRYTKTKNTWVIENAGLQDLRSDLYSDF